MATQVAAVHRFSVEDVVERFVPGQQIVPLIEVPSVDLAALLAH
jgi:hypothetical protein